LFPYLATKDGASFLTYLQESVYDVSQKYNYEEGINLFIVVPKGLMNTDKLLENSVITLQVKLIN